MGVGMEQVEPSQGLGGEKARGRHQENEPDEPGPKVSILSRDKKGKKQPKRYDELNSYMLEPNPEKKGSLGDGVYFHRVAEIVDRRAKSLSARQIAEAPKMRVSSRPVCRERLW
jgi:hypothetical protein